MDNKKITRVCYPVTLYIFLQYLLLSTPEEIKQTFFFFPNPCFKEIAEKVEHKKYFSFGTFPRFFRIILWLPYWLWYMTMKEFFWKFLKTSELFLADHCVWGAILGRKYKYNLLEDGIALYADRLLEQNWGTIREWLLSPFPKKCWGLNDNCKTIYMTHKISPNSPLQGKHIEVNSFEKCWLEATKEKRNMILNFFGVTQEDLALIKKHKTLVLTQPFSEIKYLTEKREIQSYSNMIADLKISDFLIKLHPAEKKDYCKHFPQADVYTKPMPMELFCLLGCNFEKVITVTSTAVLLFKGKAEIIWYGEKFSEELNLKMNTQMPESVKNILADSTES